MIVLLFAKMLFQFTTVFDYLIKAVLDPFGLLTTVTTAVQSIFGVMIKVSMYLFALFPYTVGMIYSWIFVYFSIWLLYQLAGIIASFIPRHSVVR